jgi:hypothetical protein
MIKKILKPEEESVPKKATFDSLTTSHIPRIQKKNADTVQNSPKKNRKNNEESKTVMSNLRVGDSLTMVEEE